MTRISFSFLLDSCNLRTMLYRNNLKDREFGKEAAQIFGSGANGITQEQDVSEDQKVAAKLTQPKTDFSGCFGIKIIAFLFSSLFALQINLGGHRLEVDVADTQASWTKGLSGRGELPDGRGMLFVFKKPRIASFWMKNTTIPLSGGFFDQAQVLVGWEDMDPPQSEDGTLPIYTSKIPIVYALEVPKGWFDTHKVQRGMKFRFEKNSSSDLENRVEF